MNSINNINTVIPGPPDKEVLAAIENIKSTMIIQKENGNPNADFILRRMR